ncbi:MAG: hypothetical protein JO056_09745 [Alphaproteobacteria bacterium]|jgi:hypothetical protein|nr:hypothetical protein [Alphaproteobacteria bacterium]
MARKLDTWRLDYFINSDDLLPARSEVVEATDEQEATDMAAENMDDAMRVDIVRTVVKRPG